MAVSASLEPITLDCDQVMTHAGGDPELLIQLCTAFLNELPLDVELLANAIRSKDCLLANRGVRQLNHCLATLGSDQISFTLNLIDRAIQQENFREAQHEALRLEVQLESLVPQVQRLVLEVAIPKSVVQ